MIHLILPFICGVVMGALLLYLIIYLTVVNMKW